MSRTRRSLRLITMLGLSAAACIGAARFVTAQQGNSAQQVAPRLAALDDDFSRRPHYAIDAAIDYELLTLKSRARIDVPVHTGDTIKDVVFFIYANAGGVGGDDERRKNIVVDRVSLQGRDVPFKLEGAVLRVTLPQAATSRFQLQIEYHGVVPRTAPGSGGLGDMMGALGTDISGLLGGALGGGAAGGATQPQKTKNTDYGLYTYGNGILSLGSFWYPSLAVRRDGNWIDEAPEGLGDVAFSEMSDFDVSLDLPPHIVVAAMGPQPIAIFGIGQRFDGKPTTISRRFRAHNVRDFAVLMSEDYVVKSKPFTVGAKSVTVESYTTKANAAKADKAIDIAGRSLQIFARRFGPYPYSSFKVVEGPIKGGAGGMEYSGMTAIASMLYGDWGKQIEALAGSMGLGGMDKLFADEADGATEGRADAGAAGGFVQGMLGEQKQMLDSIFETTIAHEVAHQWWAIGVGSDSVRAPFVDESLTNYCAMLYFEDRYGKEKAQQMMDVHLRTTYSMGRMLGSADVPVALKTSAYGNNLQYGAIVYGKGALYYDALRALVGDEVFFAALRRYYLEYSNKLAGQRTLLDMMKQAAPAKAPQIEALFARWIEGTNGDADITGGKPAGLSDLLGGILGGNLPGALPGEE